MARSRLRYVSDAQALKDSSIEGWRMRKYLETAHRGAREKMQKLKDAGYGKSEFYQNHKNDFKRIPSDRGELMKEVAYTNRFLNSKSSTVRGMKKALDDKIDVYNERFFDYDKNVAKGNSKRAKEEREKVHLDRDNILRFEEFMRYYKTHVKSQLKLPSDIVADAFIFGEKNPIKKKDLQKNLGTFWEYQDKLESMSVEDLFANDKVDKRYRFSLDDYINAYFDKKLSGR